MRHLRLIQIYLLWSLPTAALVMVIWLCALPVRRRRAGKRGARLNPAREFILLLFCVYSAVLFSVTLNLHDLWVSLFHGWPLPPVPWFQGGMGFTPFDGALSPYDLIMLAGNLLLFVPFGALGTALWRWKHWRTALLAGFALSLAIECAQLIIGRIFDFGDLLLNTLGALLGWYCCKSLVLS